MSAGLAVAGLHALGWALVALAAAVLVASLISPSLLFVPAAVAVLISIVAAVAGHFAADLRREPSLTRRR